MKLSEVLEAYLVTSVSEGTNVVSSCENNGLIEIAYTDYESNEYEAAFEDQEITWVDGNCFVVSCDGQPWQFAAWKPVR